MSRHVVVVGGGIAGLTVAYRLTVGRASRAGGSPAGAGPAAEAPPLRVTLLEAEPRLGGKICTERIDGFVVEAGPDSFLSTKPWAVALASELGMEEELQPTDARWRRAFVRRGGRLHPLPEGLSGLVPTRLAPVLTSGLLSPSGRARVVLEPLVPRRREPRAAPRDDEASSGEPGRGAEGEEAVADEAGAGGAGRGGGEEESVAAFVRRRFGREAWEWLMGPLLTGIYGGGGETLGIDSAFPALARAERDVGSVIRGVRASTAAGRRSGGPARFPTPFVAPAGGMESLTRTLCEALRAGGEVQLRSGTRVTGLDSAGGRFRVEVGGQGPLEADAVVLAVPAPAAAEVVRALDPMLAQEVAAIPFATAAVATFAFSSDAVSHSLQGYGYLNPEHTGRPVMGVTWSSSKFGGRAPRGAVLLRAYLREPACAQGDERLRELVEAELSDTLGTRGPPLWWRVHRWPRAMPRYVVGHAARVRRIEGRADAHPGLFLTGHSYRGVGIPDTIRAAEEVASRVFGSLRQAPAVA